tara:strand:+ start:247 stop:807 length:561 start_codon:yes stop_codon:yes gene_type:complete
MKIRHKTSLKLILLASAATFLAACQTPSSFRSSEHIDFRADRYNELRLVADFNGCKNEGLELDRRAQESKDFSLHLASAEKLLSCHYELDGAITLVDQEQNMKVVALSAQNFVKGGSIERARAASEVFDLSFSGRDLVYPDGSSFKQTMSVILDDSQNINQFALASTNARPMLKKEIRRAWHWMAN